MNISFLFRFLLVVATVFCVLFLFVWFYMAVTMPADAAEPPAPPRVEDVTFERGLVQLRSRFGGAYAFDVEIATTPEQQSLGLMYRTELAAKTGMLFVYKPPRRIAMWMKNTHIPLDMLFINRKGTVFYIFSNAVPLSEELIPAPADAAFVLEVPAGTVKALGLEVGDRLVR